MGFSTAGGGRLFVAFFGLWERAWWLVLPVPWNLMAPLSQTARRDGDCESSRDVDG